MAGETERFDLSLGVSQNTLEPAFARLEAAMGALSQKADSLSTIDHTLGVIAVRLVEGGQAGEQAGRKVEAANRKWFVSLKDVEAGYNLLRAGAARLERVILGPIEAAISEERGIRALSFTLEQNGIAWDDVSSRVEAFAARVQDSTRFADDAAREALAAITTATTGMGIGFERIEEGASLALDIMERTGRDATAAGQIVASAFGGNVREIGALIPGLRRELNELTRDAQTEGERAQIVWDALVNTFGGAAGNIGETDQALAELKNNWGDFVEVVGGAMAELLSGPLGDFADLLRDALSVVREDAAHTARVIQGTTLEIEPELDEATRALELNASQLAIHNALIGSGTEAVRLYGESVRDSLLVEREGLEAEHLRLLERYQQQAALLTAAQAEAEGGGPVPPPTPAPAGRGGGRDRDAERLLAARIDRLQIAEQNLAEFGLQIFANFQRFSATIADATVQTFDEITEARVHMIEVEIELAEKERELQEEAKGRVEIEMQFMADKIAAMEGLAEAERIAAQAAVQTGFGVAGASIRLLEAVGVSSAAIAKMKGFLEIAESLRSIAMLDPIGAITHAAAAIAFFRAEDVASSRGRGAGGSSRVGGGPAGGARPAAPPTPARAEGQQQQAGGNTFYIVVPPNGADPLAAGRYMIGNVNRYAEFGSGERLHPRLTREFREFG